MTKIAPAGNALRVAHCLGRTSEGFIRWGRCIVELDRGHIDRDRYPEHRSPRCTSQMRHFIELTFAPPLLSSGMAPSASTRALIPGAGTSVRRAPRYRGALAGTKNIAAIAAAANAHRHAAAPAAVQPVALFPHLHRTPPQDWTAPCFARINTVRKVAPTGISPLEAREFFKGFPGLRCFGVACSLSGNGSARHGRKARGKKTDAGASAANDGRLRFDYHVDGVNKLKMIKNRLPGHRWSSRAFPRNYADLDPHPQGVTANHTEVFAVSSATPTAG